MVPEVTEYTVDGGTTKGTLDSTVFLVGQAFLIRPYEKDKQILAEIPERNFTITYIPNNNYTFSHWAYNSGKNAIYNGQTVTFTNSYLKLENGQIFSDYNSLNYVHVTAQENNLIIKFEKRIVKLTNMKLSTKQFNYATYFINDIFTAFAS